MITTKRGKEGKARISFTTSASILAPTKLVEQANSYEYATFYNAMNRNDGASPVFSDAVIQKFQDGTDPIRFPSIKWTDYIMGDATLQSQHNVNISGGTDKVLTLYQQVLILKEDFSMSSICRIISVTSTGALIIVAIWIWM